MPLYISRKLDTEETRTFYIGSDLTVTLVDKSSKNIVLDIYDSTTNKAVLIPLKPNDLYILRTGEVMRSSRQLEAELQKVKQPYIIAPSTNSECDSRNPTIGISAERDIAIVRLDVKNQMPNPSVDLGKKVMEP